MENKSFKVLNPSLLFQHPVF